MEDLADFDAFLNERPSLDELFQHVNISTKWYQFGVLLKLNPIKLDEIEHQYKDSDFKALKMFEQWLSTNPNAKRREIIETLRIEIIGQNAIAQEYLTVLTESEIFISSMHNKYCYLHLFYYIAHSLINETFQKHSKSLSQLVLSKDLTQMLYTEGIISKETFIEVERSKSEGSLSNDTLRPQLCTVFKDPNKLRAFVAILLQSEDTVHVGKNILKDSKLICSFRM